MQWLSRSLYGSDNRIAALKKVSIMPTGGGDYRIYIANQFSFACKLNFGPDGNPAALSECAPYLTENLEWRVVEAAIPLKCTEEALEIVCKGRYTLASNDFTSPDEMTIAHKK